MGIFSATSLVKIQFVTPILPFHIPFTLPLRKRHIYYENNKLSNFAYQKESI